MNIWISPTALTPKYEWPWNVYRRVADSMATLFGCWSYNGYRVPWGSSLVGWATSPPKKIRLCQLGWWKVPTVSGRNNPFMFQTCPNHQPDIYIYDYIYMNTYIYIYIYISDMDLWSWLTNIYSTHHLISGILQKKTRKNTGTRTLSKWPHDPGS